MTRRRTAILVTAAVVAGAVVAGVGLATESSPKPKHVLQIDEVRGRIGVVVLGETQKDVLAVLGAPPVVGSAGKVLVYPHLEVRLAKRLVASVSTTDGGASTLKVVRVGDPLSAVRALYRKSAHCIPNTPDKTAPNPHCRVSVPAGLMIVRGDPISEIELTRTG
jgi:hypothetical protein